MRKRKWPKLIAMGLTLVMLVSGLALVLVEKLAPDQTLVPQSLVRLPSRLLSIGMRPLQGAFAWVASTVEGYLAQQKLYGNIEIEYNKLRAQNDELIYKSLLNDELEAEIERYKDLLGVFDDYMTMNPVLAKVTAKETGNWFQVFTIDRGSRHGVKANMAVVNADGLIGYIYKVYDMTAEIITIVDSRASIAALIESSRDQGMIKGTLGIDATPSCRMYYLPVNLVPRPGDTVVTSGVGLPFPKGLRIGVVRESTRYMDENKHYVVIEPYVDFMHIEEVVVLVYEATAESMPQANDGQLTYVVQPLDTYRPVPGLGEQIDDPQLGAVTPPPRPQRVEPTVTLAPGATPTPNPELDALMQEELERDGLSDEENP